MRRFAIALLIAAACPAASGQVPQAQFDPAAWRAIVDRLASDEFEGREAGTPGYDRAAAWTAERFRAAGLRPAGDAGGWLQQVDLVRQRFDARASSLSLVGPGGETPLAHGPDIILSARAPLPRQLDAPIEFVGYGLHLPRLGHDDFAGRNLRGKIVVYVRGFPTGLDPLAVADAYGRLLPEALERAGALGSIQLFTPKMAGGSWPARAPVPEASGFYLADPRARDASRPMLGGTLNPARYDRLFAGVPGGFAPLAAAIDGGKRVGGMALKTRLRARLVASETPIRSHNVVGLLPGSDPALAREAVVLSAHLDHLGLGAPGPDGRRAIFRGAQDNASGVASLVQVAEAFAKGPRPRRSLLFVALTAEEKGLLGSRAFVARPNPAARPVANINMDMFLPFNPMRQVIVYGGRESSLGVAADAAAAAIGVRSVPDPRPDEFRLIRSDQYSFIRAGIPAISAKIEWPAGSPEDRYREQWIRERYHQVADDLTQPIDGQAAATFNRFLEGTIRRVADDPARPAWRPGSHFERPASSAGRSPPR